MTMKVQNSSSYSNFSLNKAPTSSALKSEDMNSSVFGNKAYKSAIRTGNNKDSLNNLFLKTQISELDGQIEKFSSKANGFLKKPFEAIVAKLKTKKAELQNTYAKQIVNSTDSKFATKLNRQG